MFARRAYRSPPVPLLVGVCMLAACVTSAAGLAVAFARDHLQSRVDVPESVATPVFLAVVTALNARGIQESSRADVVMTTVRPLLEVVAVADVGVPEQPFSAIALVDVANGALLTMIMAPRSTSGFSHSVPTSHS